ncbi:MAG: nucleoside-diphosphate kinase [Candidatus Peribacteria bacterium]|jgi:nucleoside-diphosphate kinase|nr:nucleoside-diphosphate kinase [Candidatus Peribacteria bacterium]
MEETSRIERTLIVFKPDAVSRAVVGEILARFEKRGLKIVGMKMVRPDKDFFYHHYETIGQMVSRWGDDAFTDNLHYMQLSPVIAVVLEGIEVVKLVRQMVGPTMPQDALSGTIRGDYAQTTRAYSNPLHRPLFNLIHASGKPEEAEQEIAHWFREEELFEYSRGDKDFLY